MPFSLFQKIGAGGRETCELLYLYGLERVGDLAGRRLIGSHDWYREGADWLLGAQREDDVDVWVLAATNADLAQAVEEAPDLEAARAASERINENCQGCHEAAGVADL